jgi:hypothetical protein
VFSLGQAPFLQVVGNFTIAGLIPPPPPLAHVSLLRNAETRGRLHFYL